MKSFLYSFLVLVAFSFCADSYARTVKGMVTCGQDNLSGVMVTDGMNFTKTRKNGSFKMKIDDNARFVYIVTPSGYAADWSRGVPQFYQESQGKDFFVFDLIKTGDDLSCYHLIAVGDPQPRKDIHFEEFAGKPLDDICNTVSTLKEPTVGVVLGDICFDVFPLMKKWKDNIPRAGIPFYTVPGNHDHNRKVTGNDDLALAVYNEHFGPGYYAFHMGKDLVIMLDNIIYHNKKDYEEGYTEDILKWVKSLLKHIPQEADIYVVQHSPLNGRSPLKSRGKLISNAGAMMDILKSRNTTFISGHNHISNIDQYAPNIMEHNVASICGTWWDAYHCKDGTPRGYKVFTKYADELHWYYKSIGKDKDFQYEIFLPGEAEMNPESVVLNIWDYDPQWHVEWWEDGKPMGEMKQVEEKSPLHMAEITERYASDEKGAPKYKKTAKARHYFAARPKEGASKITVRIRNRFGNEWTEDIAL